MKKSTFFKTFLVVLALVGTCPLEAKLLQILHTNDTHSYLDNSTHSSSRGGVARLKALMDFYKAQAKAQGMETIAVDAGDFLEGNLYYMAQDGRASFNIHNEMGYDIGTLGNHDYQMGSVELNKILGEIDLKFSLVAANLDIDDRLNFLAKKIAPYKEISFEGVKLAFLGLTTDELFYKWRMARGAIKDPIESAQLYEQELKSRGNDYIIALTHIGVLRDLKLVEKTKYIDLVIGGHSHTALYRPIFEENKRKNFIPIVQAGMHTEYLGRLVVDLEKGKPLKIKSYELVPVRMDSALADQQISRMVNEADAELDASYGQSWLNEEIGFSDLKPNDELGTRKWAYFITDALKEKSGADIAIHSPDMNGENYPVGVITRRSILNSIPRVFEFSQKYGWDIYTTKIKGVWLRMTMDALSYFGQPLIFSGMKMEYERGPFGFKIKKMTVNGKKVNPFKTYTVAFTEGIIRGAEGIDPRTVAILRHPKNTNFKIWATLEERVRESKGSLNQIGDDGHSIMWPNR